jgi:hypothetical protein
LKHHSSLAKGVDEEVKAEKLKSTIAVPAWHFRIWAWELIVSNSLWVG